MHQKNTNILIRKNTHEKSCHNKSVWRTLHTDPANEETSQEKREKNPKKSLPTLPKSLQDPSDFHVYKKKLGVCIELDVNSMSVWNL